MKKRVSCIALMVVMVILSACDAKTQAPAIVVPGKETEVSNSAETAVVEISPSPVVESQDVPITENIEVILPNISSIDIQERPVMWDFLNKSLGWHTRYLDGFRYFALRSIGAPGIVYVTQYSGAIPKVVPWTGGEIELVALTSAEQQAFDASRGDTYVKEGDWELFYNQDLIQLLSPRVKIFAEDYIAPDIDTAKTTFYGFDSEWLRSGEYAEKLLSIDGVDIFDIWWDNWRYMARYQLVRQDTGEHLGIVTTNFPGVFEVYSDEYPSGDGGPLHLSNNDLWMTLVTEGLTLEGAPEIQYVEEDNEF